MLLNDAGLVTLGPEDYGRIAPPSRRNLHMRIRRTPHGVVREPEPTHVPDWGRYGVTANGRIADLSGAADDAVVALDRAGPRGAAALGAAAGLLFSQNRILGAVAGGVLGYFGGGYIVNLIKKALSVGQVVSTATAVASKVS